MIHFTAPDGAVAPNASLFAAEAIPVRVAGFKIRVTAILETFTRIDYVAVLWRVLNLCIATEQRAAARFGSGDIPAALVKIDVWFPLDARINTSILGPLTADYPTLVRSLRALKIAHNGDDESAAIGAFAALATRLQELTFWTCGLKTLRALAGHCEYLRKVKVIGCKHVTNIDSLRDRVYLELVNASFSGITSIEPLRTCPNLTKVYLSNCDALPADVSMLTSVEVYR